MLMFYYLYKYFVNAQESIRDKLRGIPIEVSMALVNPSSSRSRQSGLPSLLPILDSTQESTTVTKVTAQRHNPKT